VESTAAAAFAHGCLHVVFGHPKATGMGHLSRSESLTRSLTRAPNGCVTLRGNADHEEAIQRMTQPSTTARSGQGFNSNPQALLTVLSCAVAEGIQVSLQKGLYTSENKRTDTLLGDFLQGARSSSSRKLVVFLVSLAEHSPSPSVRAKAFCTLQFLMILDPSTQNVALDRRFLELTLRTLDSARNGVAHRDERVQRAAQMQAAAALGALEVLKGTSYAFLFMLCPQRSLAVPTSLNKELFQLVCRLHPSPDPKSLGALLRLSRSSATRALVRIAEVLSLLSYAIHPDFNGRLHEEIPGVALAVLEAMALPTTPDDCLATYAAQDAVEKSLLPALYSLMDESDLSRRASALVLLRSYWCPLTHGDYASAPVPNTLESVRESVFPMLPQLLTDANPIPSLTIALLLSAKNRHYAWLQNALSDHVPTLLKAAENAGKKGRQLTDQDSELFELLAFSLGQGHPQAKVLKEGFRVALLSLKTVLRGVPNPRPIARLIADVAAFCSTVLQRTLHQDPTADVDAKFSSDVAGAIVGLATPTGTSNDTLTVISAADVAPEAIQNLNNVLRFTPASRLRPSKTLTDCLASILKLASHASAGDDTSEEDEMRAALLDAREAVCEFTLKVATSLNTSTVVLLCQEPFWTQLKRVAGSREASSAGRNAAEAVTLVRQARG